MKRRWIYLPFLLIVFLNHTTVAYDTDWTEKKLGKVILKADKAARQKKWARAIRYGEQMLQGAESLGQPNDARYINQLKNLNRYYDKAKRLREVPERVKKGYILSKEHLGPNHETTRMSRTLYYKFLISNKNYNDAISLVLENLSILKKDKNEDYRQYHYLKQLYSLYRMTGQLGKEEATLLRFLDLDKQIFNSSAKENIKIILNLANNYCRQKKFEKFNSLIKKYKLKYTC
ncbi:MAG: hypothetical protein COB49_04670 [Alphaproteobacteria bacterium]|nr:MAG: hypothetical protein COB49_04670 [Alphaproteobacteria bacterium]